MGTVHACHQVNQLRPLHFVSPLLVIPRESESGTMLVSTEFYFLSERPCLLPGTRVEAVTVDDEWVEQGVANTVGNSVM
jgi:hypothetical protein